MNYQNLVSVLPAKADIYLSLRLWQITETSVLIIHDIMLNLIQQLFNKNAIRAISVFPVKFNTILPCQVMNFPRELALLALK